MSHLLSDVLQRVLYERLSTDSALAAIVGTHVYDAMPAGPVPDLYVLLGEEAVADASDISGSGAVHDFAISVMSSADSFLILKEAAAAIHAALFASPLSLTRGHVVGLWFRASRAKRSASGQRKIDLKFRARLAA